MSASAATNSNFSVSANPRITVIDYGLGNLFSVAQALEYAGAQVTLVESGEDLASVADRTDGLVLPGVGAFSEGMAAVRERGFVEPILEHVRARKPFLGICLGMQMMLDSSEEFGMHKGLGIIPGTVKAIPDTKSDGTPHKILHIGWSPLIAPENGGYAWNGTILEGLEPEDCAYFVHSFGVLPVQPEHRIADCLYNGRRISAVVRRENSFGCQFHPEKSGKVGIRILKNFIQISRAGHA